MIGPAVFALLFAIAAALWAIAIELARLLDALQGCS